MAVMPMVAVMDTVRGVMLYVMVSMLDMVSVIYVGGGSRMLCIMCLEVVGFMFVVLKVVLVVGGVVMVLIMDMIVIFVDMLVMVVVVIMNVVDILVIVCVVVMVLTQMSDIIMDMSVFFVGMLRVSRGG